MVQFKSLGLLFFYLQFIHQYLVFDDCSPKYGYDAIRDKKNRYESRSKDANPQTGPTHESRNPLFKAVRLSTEYDTYLVVFLVICPAELSKLRAV